MDSTFGEGVTRTGLYADTRRFDVLVLPDGRFVVLGFDPATNRRALERYHASGLLDPSFGNAGRAAIGFYSAYGVALARQLDGKILVACLSGADEYVVARFDSSGVPAPHTEAREWRAWASCVAGTRPWTCWRSRPARRW